MKTTSPFLHKENSIKIIKMKEILFMMILSINQIIMFKLMNIFMMINLEILIFKRILKFKILQILKVKI